MVGNSPHYSSFYKRLISEDEEKKHGIFSNVVFFKLVLYFLF